MSTGISIWASVADTGAQVSAGVTITPGIRGATDTTRGATDTIHGGGMIHGTTTAITTIPTGDIITIPTIGDTTITPTITIIITEVVPTGRPQPTTTTEGRDTADIRV